VGTASSQPDDLVLPLSTGRQSTDQALPLSELPAGLLRELWLIAEAETYGLTLEEFSAALLSHQARSLTTVCLLAFTLILPRKPRSSTHSTSLNSPSRTPALGREAARERFLSLCRAPLTQAVIAMTGSATLGHDLADSLYSELYGLRQVDCQRRSPHANQKASGCCFVRP
jgi:RNA polymerase sigma-70 factor (ECF subfamily)